MVHNSIYSYYSYLKQFVLGFFFFTIPKTSEHKIIKCAYNQYRNRSTCSVERRRFVVFVSDVYTLRTAVYID